MKSLRFGLIFIFTGIILGALSAHLLKEIFTPERLDSFKTGVNYLIYSGLGLLAICALKTKFNEKSFKISTALIITGTILFSFSIFGLNILNHLDMKTFNFILGPITPFGGVLMICGWFVLIVNSFQQTCT